MDYETQMQLTESGRQVATGLLETVIIQSKSTDEMADQLFTLRASSIHILAMEVFNSEKILGEDAQMVLSTTIDDLLKELDFIRGKDDTGQLELFLPQGAVH